MSGAMPGAARGPGLTSGGEVASYAVAHAVKVAAGFAASPFYAGALYQRAYDAGGMIGIAAANLALGVIWTALGLALFIALRPGFGGVPAVLRRADGTAGFEIGAYALSHGIAIVASVVLFSTVMPRVFAALGIHGRSLPLTAVSIGVGTVIAALAFLLFVLLRRAFAGSAGTGVAAT